jgi:hypothetical protein
MAAVGGIIGFSLVYAGGNGVNWYGRSSTFPYITGERSRGAMSSEVDMLPVQLRHLLLVKNTAAVACVCATTVLHSGTLRIPNDQG